MGNNNDYCISKNASIKKNITLKLALFIGFKRLNKWRKMRHINACHHQVSSEP